MKRISLIFIIAVFLISCEKPEDLTEQINITDFSWSLKSLKENIHNIDFEDDYILDFSNDSLFQLNLSVNNAGGNYLISKKGEISFLDFEPFTEMCCENDFDKKLLSNLPTVSEYQVLDNDLILKGDNCEIIFEKQ
ncbi:MAG: META domain-containing protein [Bacteroidales bacterium]|nr:META domain-containing protein [Bacteroidales bacterium]